uniref:Family with sequence similarity 81 member B n=1 Tax=Gopherus evgoodei TaxID=1825980 RepID=A0A8C4XZK1_9SAUR
RPDFRVCDVFFMAVNLVGGQAFLPAIPMIPGNRVNLLENRLSSQERTTAVLLDQAFRIKDDIVSYLKGSKGHQQGETTARQLLENHIQTITSIVKKLSHDIEVLEKQIRTRDNVTTGTTFAVQSLDHKYLHGFGDLRGRVARCDASIAKLSGDINIIRHEIQRLEKEIGVVRSTSESYANNLEMKEKLCCIVFLAFGLSCERLASSTPFAFNTNTG